MRDDDPAPLDRPHDKLFFQVFSQPERAASVLRRCLPPSIAEDIRWDTLRVVEHRFHDDLLDELRADLFLHAQRRDGSWLGIFILFEHQSTSPRDMPFRILEYMVARWRRWRADQSSSPRFFPPILPIVLYTGPGRWRAPPDFADLLPQRHKGRFRPHTPSFTYVVKHVRELVREGPFGDLFTDLALRFMATPPAHFWRTVRDHADDLAALTLRPVDGLLRFRTLWRYAVAVRGPVPRDTLEGLIARLPERAGDFMRTWERQVWDRGHADGWNEGRVEGHREGRIEGHREGRIEGHREGRIEGHREGRRLEGQRQLAVALQHLFPDVPLSAEQRDRIEQASTEQLQRWFDRVFRITHPAELFEQGHDPES